MSTRVLIQGRTAWASRDYRPPAGKPANLDHHGKPIDERVLPGSPDAPFREGSPLVDQEEGITYRSVRAKVLDPAGGWRTAQFWLDRWQIEWASLATLAQMGWLDAAIEIGGATKRFRCRDEERVLAWIREAKTKQAVKTIRQFRRG